MFLRLYNNWDTFYIYYYLRHQIPNTEYTFFISNCFMSKTNDNFEKHKQPKYFQNNKQLAKLFLILESFWQCFVVYFSNFRPADGFVHLILKHFRPAGNLLANFLSMYIVRIMILIRILKTAGILSNYKQLEYWI